MVKVGHKYKSAEKQYLFTHFVNVHTEEGMEGKLKAECTMIQKDKETLWRQNVKAQV